MGSEGWKDRVITGEGCRRICWRDTPWGDMTRIQNRTERWDAPEESVYPSLHTKH